MWINFSLTLSYLENKNFSLEMTQGPSNTKWGVPKCSTGRDFSLQHCGLRSAAAVHKELSVRRLGRDRKPGMIGMSLVGSLGHDQEHGEVSE